MKIRWWQSLNLTDSPQTVTFITPDTKLDHDSSTNYFNREITDLAFIERVLDEAGNLEHPLLEQLSFLSISASILDQFYSVRVARLRRRLDQGNTQSKRRMRNVGDGRNPRACSCRPAASSPRRNARFALNMCPFGKRRRATSCAARVIRSASSNRLISMRL